MLEPSQYVLGGLKFVPYKWKQPEYRSSQSFVETVKAPVQTILKHDQQSSIRKKVKNSVMENISEPLRDKPRT